MKETWGINSTAIARPSTYQTGHFTPAQQAALALTAESQEGVIHAEMKRVNRPIGASELETRLASFKWPLTSIRRALTTLKMRGIVGKTGQVAVGAYGRNEHLWRIND